MNKDWNVLDSRTEYETGWYDGGYDEVEQPDETTKRYYWARLPDAVVVVAHDREAGDVVFVEQYRPAVRETHLELVAGIVEDDDGDDPRDRYEEAARRELREETGFVAGETSLVEEFRVATGVLRHSRGVVYAEVEERVEPDRGENEFIEVRRVSAEDSLNVARDAPANDATLEGLLLAREDGLL